MDDRPLVELVPAFVFTCESCGKDTFVRTAVIENPETQAQAESIFREMIAQTEGELAALEWDGVVSTTPTEVRCTHCGIEYDVSVGGYDLETLGMFYDELYDDEQDDLVDDEDYLFDDEEDFDFDEDEEDEEFEDEDSEEDF